MERVGVDVGGTFIDVVAIDEETGRCRILKRDSRRGEQSEGVFHAVSAITSDRVDLAPIVHGTTIGTNALLERNGSVAGLITTRGFRDVLEMRRRDRKHLWGMSGNFVPLIARSLRLEVDERVLADGVIETEVDLDQVREAGQKLLALGVETVCVCFINSFIEPANEVRAAECLRSFWPNSYVTASHEVLSEIREFERSSSAAVNAYLQPVVGGYLTALEARFRSAGHEKPIFITQSNGGVMSPAVARRLPVRTALSGPAAGVIAGRHIGRTAGFENVILCDMGGTSFDVSLVVGGETAVKAEAAIDFGIVIRSPMLEITTIGAGGGSIARVDRGGLLHVGPESAGSRPGPACYGLGNDRPTITDAHVILRRIDAKRPIGGEIVELDVAAAERAIDRCVASPLGLSVVDAAEAIIRVANTAMAGAVRVATIERGHDPKGFTIMMFGGAGGLHAGSMLAEVGVNRVLVPLFPGVTCALGCALADLRSDYVQTINQKLENFDGELLRRLVEEATRQGREAMRTAETMVERFEVLVDLEMSYVGQIHTVSVRIEDAVSATPVSKADVRRAFEQTYRRYYGDLPGDIPIRIQSVRTAIIGIRRLLRHLDFGVMHSGSISEAVRGHREVWCGDGWRSATVYERHRIPSGSVLQGPAILEQADGTIFLDPGLVAHVDQWGNLIMERGQ